MIYIKPEKIADKSEIIACAKKYLEKNNQLDLNEFIRNDMNHSKASPRFILNVAGELVKNRKYKMELHEGRYLILVQPKKNPIEHLTSVQFKSALRTILFSIKLLKRRTRKYIKRESNSNIGNSTVFHK